MSILRLAHRILSQRTLVPKVVDAIARESYLQQYHLAQVMIGSSACHTIIADNVAQFYADTPKQDWGLNGKNFPCVAPPFETAWFIEWKEPGYYIGPNGIRHNDAEVGLVPQQSGTLMVNVPIEVAHMTIKRFDATGEGDRLLALSGWFLSVQYFTVIDGQVLFVPFTHGVFVADTGEFVKSIFMSTVINPALINPKVLQEESFTRLHIPLLTTGFLHCKNVTRIDATVSEGPAPGWCKRKRLPAVQYHIIQIDPNIGTKPRSSERKTEGDQSGKALHICRGYFMHCINDGVNKGLFGKGIYGTFWVPSHVRGSADLGRVIPTYNVLAPTG